MTPTNEAALESAIRSLQEEIASLQTRIAALEQAAAPRGTAERETAAKLEATPAEGAAGPVPQPEPIAEEVVLAIAAAIAAFLGKKPHIRQIRLIGSGAWAQQGRVSIQASHALAVRHE